MSFVYCVSLINSDSKCLFGTTFAKRSLMKITIKNHVSVEASIWSF